MQPNQIFRKVSLDRLSSPEQLDQLMRVTDRRGWIALAGIGLVLAAALGWGVMGRLPEQVAGMGMLVKSGGIFEVIPSVGGRVTDIAVVVGDVVVEGQVVARVEQLALANRLEDARTQLANLRATRLHAREFDARDLQMQMTVLEQQRASMADAIAAATRAAIALRERVSTQEQLVQQGLMTRSMLLATRQQSDAAQQQLEQSRSQLAQIGVRQLELTNAREQEARTTTQTIAAKEAEVAQAERELLQGSEIIAPYTGRILEIMSDRGGVVSPGQPLISLDLTGKTVKDLEMVMYVPSAKGKQIQAGMPIQIAPSTVKEEEFGLMVGRVTYVSDFPATSNGMRRVLKNERLVAELSGQDAPYEVHADLVVDPSTRSQYRWTSSKGPPLRIQSGTMASGKVEVAARRPIELVMPLMRRYFGL